MENYYLYVGCGAHRLNKFLHADICVFKQFKNGLNVGPPDLLCDIVDHIPLKKESCKLIYSRGTLEHLKYEELINHLIECRRILRNDGIIRANIPDFDIFISDYINKTFLKDQLGNPKTLVGPNENYSDYFVNRTFYPDHHYLHNFDTISRALKKCGFTNVKKCLPGQTVERELSKILYESEIGRQNVEMIVEAEKNHLIAIQVFKKNLQPKNFFKKFIKYFLNLSINRYDQRKATIFEYMWFYEKLLIIKQKFFLKKTLKKYQNKN